MSEQQATAETQSFDSAMDTNQINYLEGVPCPKKAQMIAAMALDAKTNGLALFVGEIRYSIAGTPAVVCDQYIYFGPGSYEVGSTGELGKAPTDAEKLPYPKLISMEAICWVEHIKWPEGKK